MNRALAMFQKREFPPRLKTRDASNTYTVSSMESIRARKTNTMKCAANFIIVNTSAHSSQSIETMVSIIWKPEEVEN